MKKALSFILALTLALTLLPTFAMAETTETMNWDEPIVFKLNDPINEAATDVEGKGNYDITSNDDPFYGSNWFLWNSGSSSKILNSKATGKSKVSYRASYSEENKRYTTVTVDDDDLNGSYRTLAITVKVPESGIYDISADVYNSARGSYVEARIDGTSIGTIDCLYIKDTNTAGGPNTKEFSKGVAVAKTVNWIDDYSDYMTDANNKLLLVFTQHEKEVDTAGYASNGFYNFKFTPSTIVENSVKVNTAAGYEVGDTFTPSVTLNIEGLTEAKTYSDLAQAGIVLGVKEANAGVTVSDNVYSVTKSGEVTFTPTVTVNGQTHEAAPVTITVASNEPDYTQALTNAFAHESTTSNAVAVPTAGVKVNTYVYTVDGTKKNLDNSETVPAGIACEVDADTITGMDGYEFLYWAKGATMEKKQIVSGNAKYSFIPTVEATHLIAVFAPTTAEGTAKAEFYNGNGQLLPDYTVTSGENVTIPALPSMAGYDDATHWELYGDTKEYKEGDSVALSGSMVFVAQYDELVANIAVDVKGGSCDKTAYKYGDVVICTPATEESFIGWKKDGVIVSMDTAYTFNAWETCTVEAVYGAHEFDSKATKLLIDIFNDKFIMAEFIGLSNYGTVVEKGIKIGDKRFAMQKPDATQFTLEAADATEAATAVAYAIFNDGTMITDK